MAWIVCNFYVPQTFRSTVNGLGLLFLFKHQKHVQEPEIYTESNTFSPPSKAAVLSALDKNPPASLSRIFFSALLFVFSLHPFSQYRIGFMIYVPILTLVSITWTGYVQECRLLNVWASDIFRKTTH